MRNTMCHLGTIHFILVVWMNIGAVLSRLVVAGGCLQVVLLVSKYYDMTNWCLFVGSTAS